MRDRLDEERVLLGRVLEVRPASVRPLPRERVVERTEAVGDQGRSIAHDAGSDVQVAGPLVGKREGVAPQVAPHRAVLPHRGQPPVVRLDDHRRRLEAEVEPGPGRPLVNGEGLAGQREQHEQDGSACP